MPIPEERPISQIKVPEDQVRALPSRKLKSIPLNRRLGTLQGSSIVWCSTPHIQGTRKKKAVKPILRRSQSENFLHSWDYSPIPFSLGLFLLV